MKRAFLKGLLAIALLAMMLESSGCATLSPENASMQTLYDDAYATYKDEDYYNAKEKFEELIQKDPLDKYSVLAELHLADISYERENFNEAIIHYEEYLRLNQKTTEYEYVLYRIGMCHFKMMRTPDRDQTETKLALAKFNDYLERFRDGKFKDEVAKNKDIAAKVKIESEYNVGLFYYNAKKYDSAIARFEKVIRAYKTGETVEQSYLMLALSLNKTLNAEKLKSVYDEYAKAFAEGKYKHEIYNLVEQSNFF